MLILSIILFFSCLKDLSLEVALLEAREDSLVSLLRSGQPQQTRVGRRVWGFLPRIFESTRFALRSMFGHWWCLFLHVLWSFTVDNSMIAIDRAIYLQRYEEGWRDGKWETRADERPCIERTSFRLVRPVAASTKNTWSWFLGFSGWRWSMALVVLGLRRAGLRRALPMHIRPNGI